MEIIKKKLIELFSASKYNSLATNVFKDEYFELQYFERDKETVLDDLETRLLNNKQMQVVVYGLEEAVNAIKSSDSSIIVTNLISRENWNLILYTDKSYSLILGLT